MMVQLLKRVRMPLSMAAPVGVVFFGGGDGGGGSRPIVSGGNLRSGGEHHCWTTPVGIVALVGGVVGGSWIG
jgi:hypothetical protein